MMSTNYYNYISLPFLSRSSLTLSRERPLLRRGPTGIHLDHQSELVFGFLHIGRHACDSIAYRNGYAIT